jgi:hypothetical protein
MLELSIGAGGEQEAEARGMALKGFMGKAREKPLRKGCKLPDLKKLGVRTHGNANPKV